MGGRTGRSFRPSVPRSRRSPTRNGSATRSTTTSWPVWTPRVGGPSAEADRATLLRRATLDLTGLPPTPDELAAFLNDDSPDAYEQAVDRLLGSPRYGERMASEWLDAARYADTNGYQTDGERSMWRWRDWVIDAYNANMPFDRFTIEQLAGDMLPDATRDQRIATGFNRNHSQNGEGGIVVDEFMVEYAVDSRGDHVDGPGSG